MAYDIVQFKSGNKNNIPSQIVPGTVYFAIDGDKGSLYLDFDATHRILMSEHYAAEAGKATYDSTGTQSIVDTYIKGIEFDGTTDTAKVTAILERGSGDTSTTVLLPNAGASSAGIITAGAQTIAGAKTFTEAFTASGGVTFSNANFNYSGFEARSNDVATVVWFSDNVTKGKPVYDNDFTYNPSTNTLTVTNVAGTAEYATKATGDSTSIKTTYISDITTDSENHKLTFYKGDGGSTDKELNFVRLSGDTMTGDLNFASIGTWPTVAGETYPISSKGINWSGSSDGAKIFYRIDASDEGNLIIQTTDGNNEKVIFRTTSSNGDFFAINSQSRYIYPINNKTGYLGTSSNRWAAIYAAEIYEDTTNIKDKYISGWSTTDTVITIEKGSGATETINSPWLPLIGGNVTGHVNFGNTVSIDSATIRELVVTGAASFANHANFNTITVGGLAVFNANVGIGTSSPASKLHINGSLLKITNNGNTVTIGSNNSSWCHFENSANVAFYFNKKVQAVTGFAIYDGHGDWQDGYLKIINKDGGDAYLELNRNTGTNWRLLDSSGTFYLQCDWTTAKGAYYNVITANNNTGNITLRGSLNVGATSGGIGLANTSSSTGIGISLYGGPTTGAPAYGLMFAGTATFGTHGGVTSDWATYFTMNDATTRGWIFRRGSTNVASINGEGKLYLGAVTSSANPGVYWNKYVESATDASDVSAIYQIRTGVAGGTELRISQANDSGDVINICSPYYIYLNSKKAFQINDNWLRINDGGGFTDGVFFGSVVKHNGTVYFANGTTYYINNSANARLTNLELYNATGITHNVASTPWPCFTWSSRAGTSSIGTNNYTYTTIAQSNWANLYYQIPAKRTTYATAGDTSSAVTATSYYGAYFFFRQYSPTSTGTRTSYYEDYYLPTTTVGRTGNVVYNILTTKNTITTAQGGTGNTSYTAGRLIYAETTTKLSSSGGLAYFSANNTASTPVKYTRLHIFGPTSGNTAANMISGTNNGVFRFGDAGPQITFDTNATPGGGQAGALIFTDNDNAGEGVSWHFVTNQSDDNNGGKATVTAPRFRARRGLTIGQNTDNTSYALYVNGTSYFVNGATIAGGMTWPASQNINCTATANNQEWSIDLNAGSYTGTYWHVWSSKNSKSILACYPDDNRVTIPNGSLTVTGTGRFNNLLTLYREGTTANNYPAGIKFMVRDTTTAQTFDSAYIYTYQDHAASTAGTNMVIQPAGGLFIGSGEAPGQQYSAKGAAYTGEDAYFTSDQTVVIQSNAQTFANRLGFILNNSHELLPCKADVATTKVGSIGNGSYYWQRAYINGGGNIHWNNLSSPNINGTSPILTTDHYRGLGRVIPTGSRGDSLRPANILFGIRQSSIVVEYTTDGGSTWTTKSISVINLFNENTQTVTPGFNTAGTGFDAYDAESTSSTTGGGSGKTYAANYWKNKGIRITIQTDKEGRTGTIDFMTFRFGCAGTNNKAHYKVERQHYDGTWTLIYQSSATAYGNNDRIDQFYPNPIPYLCGTGTSTTATHARKLRFTFIVDDWPTAYRYAPRIISIAGYGANGGLSTGATMTGQEFARFMTAYNQPFIIENRQTGALGFDSDLLPRSRSTEGSAIVTDNVHNIGTSSRRWANIYATKVWGAVWNDYAEYRTATTTEPGRCVKEVGDDTLALSTERLQPGCEIVSDTFGFAIGETKKAQTPIAASGRVLAYPLEDREEFRNHIGEPVCSGPNGTVSIMTKEEIREYPHCIIGTISAIPDYETWGTNNVDVNGRIWIRIK